MTGAPQPADGGPSDGAGRPACCRCCPTRTASAPPSFHVLTKPTGAICNLDCTYCFFLSKEALYPGSKFRMTDETHEQYIRQLHRGATAPSA